MADKPQITNDILGEWVRQILAHQSEPLVDIPLSESVRRSLFFAKYEAHARKSPVITMDDLVKGIKRETRKVVITDAFSSNG